MSTTPSSLGLRTVLTQVRDVLETTGLKLSPSMFSVNGQAKSLINNHFVIEVVQSRDTQQYRNGYEGISRMEHTIKVSVVLEVKPLNQFDSQLIALDIEERIIKAMNAPSAFTFERVDWTETRPTLTPTREHLILDLYFTVVHDFEFATS